MKEKKRLMNFRFSEHERKMLEATANTEGVDITAMIKDAVKNRILVKFQPRILGHITDKSVLHIIVKMELLVSNYTLQDLQNIENIARENGLSAIQIEIFETDSEEAFKNAHFIFSGDSINGQKIWVKQL